LQKNQLDGQLIEVKYSADPAQIWYGVYYLDAN
jgi:hypothetical protein